MSEIVARDGAVDLDRSAIDYHDVQDPGHGNTVAAWAGVFIIFFGAIVATIASVLGSALFFWIGVAIVALGPIVGLILRAAGKGSRDKQPGHDT